MSSSYNCETRGTLSTDLEIAAIEWDGRMKFGLVPELARSNGLPEDRFPLTSEEADVVDDVLTKELDKLSVQDHDSILFSIYGIIPKVEEDQGMLQMKLEEMGCLLETLPDNEAYMEAKEINEAYVAGYRRMYLRGENYNVEYSTRKLALRFETKKDCFGGGPMLTREIRWSDLSEGAKAVVRGGFMVVPPVRDSSGRAVLFSTSQYDASTSLRDMVRVSWP